MPPEELKVDENIKKKRKIDTRYKNVEKRKRKIN